MASDNTTLAVGAGGDIIRDFADASNIKWPAGVCCYATTVLAGANVLTPVTLTQGLPVQQQGTWTVTVNAGTNLNTSALALETGGNLAALAGAVTAAKLQDNIAQINGVTPATGNGIAGSGVLRITIASDSTGQVTALQGGSWSTTPIPAATGGPSRARVKAAASTNATNIKAAAGQLYGMSLSNNTGTAKFVKFYDKASAPVVGTDTPAWTELIPANGGRVVEFSMGVPFTLGISYAITGLIADSDTTATAVDDVTGILLWK